MSGINVSVGPALVRLLWNLSDGMRTGAVAFPHRARMRANPGAHAAGGGENATTGCDALAVLIRIV